MRFLRSLWETSELKWILGLGEPSKDHTKHKANIQYRSNINIFDIFVVKKSETTYFFPEWPTPQNLHFFHLKDWEHLNSNGAQLKASQLQPVLTLAEAVMQSVAVWYNVSGSKQCWDIPEVWLVLMFQIYLLPKSESVESVQLWEWHMFWSHNFTISLMVSLQKVGFSLANFKKTKVIFQVIFPRNSRWTRPASLAIIAPAPPRWRRQQRGSALLALCRGGWVQLGVSKKRGTPKWMVYNGKPY